MQLRCCSDANFYLVSLVVSCSKGIDPNIPFSFGGGGGELIWFVTFSLVLMARICVECISVSFIGFCE